MENWLPVPGFEGVYEVSDLGPVRCILGGERRRKNHILKPRKHPGGYQTYCLSLNGQKSYFLAHKLVMEAFIGVCPNGITVNHKNGIKTDNRLINLEYVTQADNNLHAVQILHKRQGETHYKSLINDDIARQIKVALANGENRSSIMKRFGVTYSIVRGIMEGRSWKHV